MLKTYAIFIFCLFAISDMLGMCVPGSCIFTFTPNGLQGSSGSWSVNVYSSNGHCYSTENIPFDSTSPVVLTVETPTPGLVELGYYMMELVCDIEGPISGPFLDSISVQAIGTSEAWTGWNTIVYRDIPTIPNGERTLMAHAIPTIPVV